MERLPLDTDYLVREYRSGRTLKDLARELGVSINTIRRRLHEAGISTSRDRRIPLPVDDLIHRYLSGESENALAICYGVSRGVIRRRLLEAGVAIRGQSEAECIKWAFMSPERRAQQVAAAHRAKRGRPPSLESKIRHALTVERKGLHISPLDVQLATMLQERGIEVTLQKAIGPYNCDLAAYPVAVEVFGGNWHWTGRHRRRLEERFRYILNAGWHIIVVPATNISPLTPAVADYVASAIQELRRNPSRRREYRVVWRAGQFVTTGSLDDDHIAIEPPFTNRRDPITGQYQSVPR